MVILGHYGSGKTNLSLNLAKKLKKLGREPLIIDLDIVNPYFRSTDYLELTREEGIEVLGPVFGSSSIEAPSLSPGIDTMIKNATEQKPVILDVGGDPDGARALVRYTPAIEQVKSKLIALVVNTRRPETQCLEGNLAMIDELVSTATLAIDALVGNTHLAELTTDEIIQQSLPLLNELSEVSKIPLVCVTVPQGSSLQDSLNAFALPIERLVKTSWQ